MWRLNQHAGWWDSLLTSTRLKKIYLFLCTEDSSLHVYIVSYFVKICFVIKYWKKNMNMFTVHYFSTNLIIISSSKIIICFRFLKLKSRGTFNLNIWTIFFHLGNLMANWNTNNAILDCIFVWKAIMDWLHLMRAYDKYNYEQDPHDLLELLVLFDVWTGRCDFQLPDRL